MLDATHQNKDRFLKLFYAPSIDSYSLSAKSKLSLHVLRVESGKFDYEALYEELGKASIGYVLSRNQYAEAVQKPHDMHKTVKHVQDRFRNATQNKGEGGELLLYCFLETHLGAPKILSKMELKTSNNLYVNGSDGVHLLELDKGQYHLIFGESKMSSDSTKKGSSFQKGIAAAFKSIKELDDNGTYNEIHLVDSNLMKETYDDETVKRLKAILLPSAQDKSVIKQNAFGIFVGYEIDTSDWDVINMSGSDFEAKIKTSVKAMVENQYDYIKQQITKNGLEGYHFYFYALPFVKNSSTNIDKARKKIVERI